MVRLGRTQKVIIDYLRQNGGASHSYAISRSCARCKAGENFVMRSLWRLQRRGIVKHATSSSCSRLTDREKAAVAAAEERSPRASVFWVLSEDWL